LRAGAVKKVRDGMTVEDGYLAAYQKVIRDRADDGQTIKAQEKELKAKGKVIKNLGKTLKEKDRALEEKDRTIAELMRRQGRS
jgi:hypothetical protein